MKEENIQTSKEVSSTGRKDATKQASEQTNMRASTVERMEKGME